MSLKGLETKINNPHVHKNFLLESRRWGDIFKEVFSSNEFSFIKRNKNSNSLYMCRVTEPFLRNCMNIPETGGRKSDVGGLNGLGKYEIKTIIRGNVSLADEMSESDHFRLGYATDGGFRDPILIKFGEEISNVASSKSKGKLDCSLNDLGEEYRGDFGNNDKVAEFLKKSLYLVENFVFDVYSEHENEYHSWLEKNSIFK